MFGCRLILPAFSLLALALLTDAGQGQPPAKDLHGDALPASAVARLGTTRFRHNAEISFAAFVPGGQNVISVCEGGIVCVWEFPSGKEIRRIELVSAKDIPALQGGPARFINSFVNAAALSPDGKTIATSFDFAPPYNGGKGPPKVAGKGGNAAEPEPSAFRLHESAIRLHDVATGKELKAMTAGSPIATSLAFSPDGQYLSAWYNDGFLRIWEWANAKELSKVAAVPTAPWPIGDVDDPLGFQVYAPDGKTLMLFGMAKVLQFVDIPTGKEVGPRLGHITPLTSIWFTPDGRQLLTQDVTSARKWEAPTGKDLGTVKLPLKAGNALAISPDGRVGVALAHATQDPPGGFGGGKGGKGGGGGGQPAFPGAKGGGKTGMASEAVLFDTASGKELAKIALESYRNSSMLFSPDGKMLAINGASAGPKVNLYEVPSGKLLRASDDLPGQQQGKQGKLGAKTVLQLNYDHKILFSADGKTLAFHPGAGATAIVFLDTATGKQSGSITPAANNVSTALGAFSPDGRSLALEISDGTVTLFELASGQARRSYGTKLPTPEPGGRGGEGIVRFGGSAKSSPCAISPDGKLLARASRDHVLHVWDIVSGRELQAFKGHTADVTAVAFAPNNKIVASASVDTTALLWDLSILKQAAVPAKAPRPGDLEKHWQALAGNDAVAAYVALGDFVAAPKDAVAFVKERVKPAAPLDMKRIEELIGQLGDEQFKVRDKASDVLLKTGELIVPALDKALAANPPLETTRRLEQLRGKLTGMLLQGERLRAYRAVEVLERIGTPEARQALQALAKGAPGALLTTSAEAALKR